MTLFIVRVHWRSAFEERVAYGKGKYDVVRVCCSKTTLSQDQTGFTGRCGCYDWHGWCISDRSKDIFVYTVSIQFRLERFADL